MLPQQVGFVCAVLALVCCASGLFGSLGRCWDDVLYPGSQGPRAGKPQDSYNSFPVRLVPRVSTPGQGEGE